MLGLIVSPPVSSQQTVGLLVNQTPQDGLVLFSPMGATTTYLINNDGLVVNQWESAFRPALMGYLLNNGHLLRSARLGISTSSGAGGRFEQFDWDGNLVWEFEYWSADYLPHHDFEPLPDGNVLMIVWDYMTPESAIAAGRDPAQATETLSVDSIIEVRPTLPVGGEIVWEWHARDHLIQDFDPSKPNYGVVGDHPELIDFNYRGNRSDWTHFNSVDYNADLDQILLSSRTFNEIWVIDHSTTTAEAAGHTGGIYGRGGDLLYRWGNPQTYRRGSAADQKLFSQHDAQWIETGKPGEGNILLYNNGPGRPEGNYSTVDEIIPPIDLDGNYNLGLGQAFGPSAATWSYTGDPPEDLFSSGISGTQRQSNGNTLICQGSGGHFREVDPLGVVVWEYINPATANGVLRQGDPPNVNNVFKIRRYPLGFPGFMGRDLGPGDPVELFTRPFPPGVRSLAVTGVAPGGATINLLWDAASCPSVDYHLIYGELQNVATHTLSGVTCAMGITGRFSWSNAPDADLFFLIVGTDDTGVYESSWGRDSAGVERNGSKASFLCEATTKIVTSTCP